MSQCLVPVAIRHSLSIDVATPKGTTVQNCLVNVAGLLQVTARVGTRAYFESTVWNVFAFAMLSAKGGGFNVITPPGLHSMVHTYLLVHGLIYGTVTG